MVAPTGTRRDEDTFCDKCDVSLRDDSLRDDEAGNWRCLRCGAVRGSDAADWGWLVVIAVCAGIIVLATWSKP